MYVHMCKWGVHEFIMPNMLSEPNLSSSSSSYRAGAQIEQLTWTAQSVDWEGRHCVQQERGESQRVQMC